MIIRRQCAQIHINGVVQGVGYRPFVYNLAQRFHLLGWVRNSSGGVDIEVDGDISKLKKFIQALQLEAPPLAQVEEIKVEYFSLKGFNEFSIISSQRIDDAFQPISPDVSICKDCFYELFNSYDRRYRYPFINCTNCGPRLTIIQDIPYDRPSTTMSGFNMCQSCALEYNDPADRRFHAQPIACHQCGPQVWLEDNQPSCYEQDISTISGNSDEVIRKARALLAEGKIIAIKGIGGFHLSCDASNSDAVSELRRRKIRVDKPFGIMMADLHTIAQHCRLLNEDKMALESIQRPIVILERLPTSNIAEQVSPNQSTLGVMLPYTPLHYLLLEPSEFSPTTLVMTSGNISEEPIVTSNEEARKRLSHIADAFLMHDRDIFVRCDDSVVRTFRKRIYPVRRARGYAPSPILLDWKSPSLLAGGSELKNTFCITNQRYAFVSHHIGDLENFETLRAFEDNIKHYERIFRVKIEGLAYDLHPNYLATRYILSRSEQESIPAIGVQHHHAHIAACMVENHLTKDTHVIGISFDGNGYGEDGAIWGGEVLIASYVEFHRRFHLAYTPLVGGDVAVQEPWRLALTWLDHSALPWSDDLPPIQYLLNISGGEQKISTIRHQIFTGINSILTSSMGRLFDAVASLIGIRHIVKYEAQAAIELELKANQTTQDDKIYPFNVSDTIFDAKPVFVNIVQDLNAGVPIPIIATRFHKSIAILVKDLCRTIRSDSGLDQVVLSGGVWQNINLLNQTLQHLEIAGFRVYIHHRIPTNDGGISLGQVAIAAQRMYS